jgi:UDP-N-acetylmuramate dehydrogenase
LTDLFWRPEADPAAVQRLAKGLVNAGVAVTADRPLGPLTTFGVGGRAAIFVEPEDEAQLETVMRAVASTAEDEVPLLVVGKGSNLLVADSGFPGLAVRLGRGFARLARDGEQVRAGGAVSMPQLAAWTAREGLAGMEFAAAIPATVGGSVRMNAGAHGAEMVDVLVEAELFAPRSPGGERVPAERLAFRYRHSELPPRSVVTGATLRLRSDDPAQVAARLAEHRAWRRRTQPLRSRSCGSTFTNPPGDSAGRLIEAAGGMALSVGRARVSEKHANFVVVEPGARAADVLQLIRLMRESVAKAGGPLLVPEVRAVGDFGPAAESAFSS